MGHLDKRSAIREQASSHTASEQSDESAAATLKGLAPSVVAHTPAAAPTGPSYSEIARKAADKVVAPAEKESSAVEPVRESIKDPSQEILSTATAVSPPSVSEASAEESVATVVAPTSDESTTSSDRNSRQVSLSASASPPSVDKTDEDVVAAPAAAAAVEVERDVVVEIVRDVPQAKESGNGGNGGGSAGSHSPAPVEESAQAMVCLVPYALICNRMLAAIPLEYFQPNIIIDRETSAQISLICWTTLWGIERSSTGRTLHPRPSH